MTARRFTLAWRRRPLSLGSRLLLASLLLVVILLPLAGLGLSWNFRLSATTAFDNRLESLQNALLASVEQNPVSGAVQVTGSLGDPRFERPYSGWYWQVEGADTLLTSRSLWDRRLPERPGEDAARIYSAEGPRGQRLRIISREIQLSSRRQPLEVSLGIVTSDLEADIDRFQRLLALLLSAFGALLLIGLALQMRWGLAPMRRLSASLAAVHAGEMARLDSRRLPTELAALAQAINGVLERDRQLIERGRAAAGNLAHALKTPLSVLKTRIERLPAERRQPLETELARIDDAVRHHLARASASGGGTLHGRVAVGAAIEPVVTALARLAERRAIVLERHIDATAGGRIDPQDLQELTGNLLENALAWAHSRVRLQVVREGGGVRLRIEDDGPGMTAAQCEAALKRGERLDSAAAGSGLGLAIVEDLVSLYGGSLVLERAAAGGLAVAVWLPASPVATDARGGAE
ncbi:sensor histidine kinase [Kushneria aurantia]|uniref:histidine kinase n=1 Tax=Kushneria aurantia TaxID=504092 RepID=A0ABV6G0K7_9GAMM|nr:HAMP domain-containing sensor histidine kinase [Kushneria aurantia]